MAPMESFLASRFPVVAMVTSGSWEDQLRGWFAQLCGWFAQFDFGGWFGQLGGWFTHEWEQFLEWASQPHVIAAVLAWIITFWVVCIFILGGFGPAGVVAGTLAAAFQSYAYAGFTPAGSIFATLTSMGMLGTLVPPVFIVAATLATAVSAIVWLCGVGR
ncbi:hypothetical protein C8A01DRAFT_34199 [Parachaetomium inaequale]|uniref:Transmembrane protein n=1 Tax=Parachaetomium inaequale TaxID=2588326 RepID=A0AAN6PNF7_9PEZI|nr:hypothetical protein C8A01DRAFT_34199 [Parachaetomium inaequale]